MGKKEKTEKIIGNDNPWFDIVETKIMPSLSTSTLLERDRLEQFLNEALPNSRVILVTAPAGSGKSSLISAWSAQLEYQKIPVAWVNLERDDSEPIRFLSYITAAIYGACPSSTQRAGSAIGASPQGSAEQILLALVADITSTRARLVLFLEDYHLVQGEEIDGLLSQLIQLASANLLIVLTSRQKTNLSLGNLKIQGQLKEIGAPDLAFQFDEVNALVADQADLKISKQTIQLLCNKTEGWIAGIQLFFLAVKGGSNAIELLQSFSGTDRDITDYLSETVLRQQPEDIRDFLLQTAPLERMCAELCQNVSGNNKAKAMLEELERRNLFIISLDRSRHWFRYHHLFAEFLRSRLETIDPEGMARCLRAAMQWSKKRGYTSEAIAYALKAEDFENASQMIVEVASDLVQYQGAHTTLLHWIKRLPQEYLSHQPLIRLYYAWSLAFTRQHSEAHRQLDLLETECRTRVSQDKTVNNNDRDYVELSAGMIRVVIMGLRGQYKKCRTLSAQWLERWPDAPSFNVGSVANALGYSCIGTFEFTTGTTAVRKAVTAFQECGADYGVAWAWAIEGMLAYGKGDIVQARKIHEDALAIGQHSLKEGSHTSGIHMILLARALYEANILDESRKLLNDGFYCISEIGSPEFTRAGYTVLARLKYVDGDLTGALEALDEAISLANRYGMAQMIPILVAEKVSLLLRENRLDLAIKEAEHSNIPSGEFRFGSADTVLAFEAHKLTNVRIHLASSNAGKANAIVTTLVRSARNSNRDGLLITLLILKAISLRQLDRERESFRALNEALILAARHNQIRRFTDEGPKLVELLKDYLVKKFTAPHSQVETVSHDYLRRLAAVCEISTGIITHEDVEEIEISSTYPIEPMTVREIELLKLVEKGHSNKELADTLYISEKTVKWHLHNAFSKLGVKNRSGAVARVRSLGLI